MTSQPLLSDPHGAVQALRLTCALAATTTDVAMLLGAPLAWWLARGTDWRRDVVGSILTLPLVLPPTVLGFYLLLALGPSGVGGALSRFTGRPTLAFTFTGLVIGSVIAALPYVVQSARAAFETVGRAPVEIAYTLRASPLRAFWTVAVPLAAPGLLAAAVLAFAHTMGEFGLVLMIGGDIPGRTRVLAMALYDDVEAGEWREAHLIAGGMVGFAFVVILIMTLAQKRLARRKP
ncbi:molybdate ABC transporter permease [Acetobacter nitrogenifigens DSM 23921 = NBRC 105050]|uniref:Molybdenum transport system permease n=1 Tax=Acetobacter nitrogenifigens DSM 23921 = NBRC 105050 TaxID=1120919 RepID=A0A511X943_9PROT|nr:molybdate ABC transporter permease subunit [Acetobacter nitrogenifigens]GBQ87047.1 molybdate ABC transporter permease [Acetobacter nitrogenifigens DSM 23921 = NBRC 105050]GEN59454.1 molybdenum ABC transporter permease subunit [Acetobacter nitrogenifigens DSM 23921 = NBRC 105050]